MIHGPRGPRRGGRRGIVAVAMSAAAFGGAARVDAEAPPADAPMSVAQVRELLGARRAAGEALRGYGKTVFAGTRIERFEVEILDVLTNFQPQQDVILIRARHPILERGGIVAGMSGSPVYVDGRVIGAVAFGWQFAKEPIAGVMPIHAMLEELRRPLERRADARPAAPAERVPLQRVRTPLLTAGFGARAVAALEAELSPWGFLPLQAGGGGADDRTAGLEPGSAVGVQLISGDANLTAVGTLTYRDGDLLLAFGHPFFNAGEIALPMTTAVVHAVMPSLAMPFKLASPGREVGALVQDRTACVAGRLGPAPPRIPLDVTIRSPGASAGKRFHFLVARHEILTAALVRAAVYGAVDAYEPGLETNTVTVSTTIRLRGLDPVVVKDAFISRGHTFSAEILRGVGLLLANPFEKSAVEALAVDLHVRHEERLAEIKNAWLDEAEVEVGRVARLNVALRIRHGPDEIRRLEIPVPPGVRGRDLTIRISGGAGVDPEAPPPTNLRELAAALQAPLDPTRLVAVVALPAADLRYRGNVLDRIPNSILGPLVPGIEDRALVTSSSLQVSAPTDRVIQGAAEIRLRIP